MIMNGLVPAANMGFIMNESGLKVQTGKAENHKSFKDILSSKTDNDVKNVKFETVQTDDSIKCKTFRDLKKAIISETGKPAIQEKKVASAEEDKCDDSSTKETYTIQDLKAGMVLNCLAQLMGVKPEEMSKLLDAAGIKPEDLAGASAPELISSKLSTVLGIDSGMQETLAKILKIVNSQVDTAISDLAQTPAENDAEVETVEKLMFQLKAKTESGSNEDRETGFHTLNTSELEELQAKLKVKLKELGTSLDDNHALVDKISLKIQPVLQKIKIQVKQPINTEGNVDSLSDTTEKVDGTTTGSDVKNEAKTIPDESSHENTKKADDVKTLQNTATVKVQEPVQQLANSASQIQLNNQKAEEIQIKVPVQAREIISQVVEKAKVVLTGDKSEMIMDLKPDSLGKISLKVVTEQGIVMAKFVAESQQVKQVLESNMQLLKDSLEKQGLDVQGFSVSVRQESRNSNNGYSGQKENRQIISPAQPTNINRLYGEISDSGILQRNNPYLYEAGTINLRA